MATKKGGAVTTQRIKKRKKRPGIHGKKKTSKIKSSKLYKKKNVGQG